MKFCVDCKYYQPEESGLTAPFTDGTLMQFSYSKPEKCTKDVELFDPVSGKPGHRSSDRPIDMRYGEVFCGIEAKWFQPKTPLA